jgi:hypothetical protein
LVADESNGDRPSITEVEGTIAHFEMAYSPEKSERLRFGPPLRERLPSLAFLGVAFGLALLVFGAYAGWARGSVYTFIVERDMGRPVSSIALTFVIVVSALATVVRAQMRGVTVHADGVEARYILPMGIPRVRKWAWPQIHRVIFSQRSIAFELWDGTFEHLPDVAAPARLGATLEAVARTRSIQVTHLA